MKPILTDKKGFTMVELMIVVIIVGILAVASVPLYVNNVKRAIRTEAEATLGAIRSAERIYKAEYNTYTNATSAQVSSLLGVEVIDPHFFDADCYDVTSADSDDFLARCTVDNTSDAPGAAQAKRYFSGTVFTMDEKGVFSE